MTNTTNTAARYTASIAAADESGLVDVDIRTLHTDRLARLTAEAAEAGDTDLYAIATEVLASR